jgi:hypothetical protein
MFNMKSKRQAAASSFTADEIRFVSVGPNDRFYENI